MTQYYYGTKKVEAWPQKKDGKPGYVIKCKDGYISWSPAEVFEDAYQPLNAMSFGHALSAAKEGYKIARSGWNGKGMWVELQTPDTGSKMTLPYLYLNYPDATASIGNSLYPQGARVPWLASQTDILANDWQIIE